MSVKILIVDDEEEIGFLLQSYFTREGYVVSTALTAQEAKTLIESSVFDVVLLDILLPDMDGLDLLDWCQEQRPEMPVFMMSGFGQDKELIKEASERGARAYFDKTLPLNGLNKEILKVLRERGGNHERCGVFPNFHPVFIVSSK